MKKLIYTLISLTILTSLVFPQQKDSLIQLYPGLGDTLDQFDRDYFEIFQNIEGFEYAVFYIRDNKHLVSNVTYSKEGLSRDTVFIQRLAALLSSRKRIEQIEKENERKFESPLEFIIATKNGNKYECNLEMFNKNELFFNMEEYFLLGSLGSSLPELKYKLQISEVAQLTIIGESNALSSMGWGALIGLGLGAIPVFSGGNNSIGGGGIILIAAPILGGLIGLIAGLVSSSDDEVIQIESQYDILKLKDYAKYYFGYNEELEEIYEEIE